MANELKPCGGCGATSDRERCIGCLHDFGTPESAWVRTELSPGAIAIGKVFHGDEGELDELTQTQRRTLNIAAALAAEAERNTRPAPAATDTGLVTVAWEKMDSMRDPNDKLVYEIKFPRNGDKRLVYKSQAEEILAAERAEKERLAALLHENGTPRFNAVCERAEKAEADNAAKEVRIKELEKERDHWKEYSSGQGKLIESGVFVTNDEYVRLTALEAKLAAAEEVAQLVIQAEEDKSGDPNFYILMMQTAYDKARAVLGGKP